MVRMDQGSKQLCFEYSLYFIAASYFKEAECKNTFREKKMWLQYQELKLEDQYRFEEICIRYMEDEMLRCLPRNIWQEKMYVQLLPVQGLDITEIRFVCPDYILRLRGEYRGTRNSRIYAQIWVRTSKICSRQKGESYEV